MGKQSPLRGGRQHRAPLALLIVDMINDLEFEGGASLLRHARPLAARLAALKRRCKARDVPVIYVNDNFGHWRGDFRRLLAHCLEDDVRGAPLARALTPEENDYFVMKPKHSAFFATPLELLLQHLKTRRVVVTGIAGDSCVLATANDAHMRDYEVHVPRDGIASITKPRNDRALAYLDQALGVDTRPLSTIRVPAGRRDP